MRLFLGLLLSLDTAAFTAAQLQCSSLCLPCTDGVTNCCPLGGYTGGINNCFTWGGPTYCDCGGRWTLCTNATANHCCSGRCNVTSGYCDVLDLPLGSMCYSTTLPCAAGLTCTYPSPNPAMNYYLNCYPTPYGTCENASAPTIYPGSCDSNGTCIFTTTATTPILATTTSLTTTVTAGSLDVDNYPWVGGNLRALPLVKFDILMNITHYDNRDRPPTAIAAPTPVQMAVFVQNIIAVSEVASSCEFDLFFYLGWSDQRLDYTQLPQVGPPNSYMELQGTETKRIWVPSITAGNVLAPERQGSKDSVVFLLPTGLTYLKSRIFTTAYCAMNLQRYPFDTQTCPIYFGLFGDFATDVNLTWAVPQLFNMTNPRNPFSIKKDVTKATWIITNYSIAAGSIGDTTDAVCAKFFNCFRVDIVLTRKFSFYLIDTYLPTGIILLLSCCSFWLNPANVPARVTFSLTLFLTLQAANTNVRSKLPNVSYTKAIDIWLFFAQAFLLCVILELVFIHCILSGYISPHSISWGSGKRTIGTQMENGGRDAESNSKWSGSVVAKWKADEMVKTGQKIERFSRILFPVVLVSFVLCYFLVYLT